MSVGKVISCPSQRPVAALRVPVAQVKVGAEVEVDSHWFVCSFRVPVAQDVEGAEVEVDSHWFVSVLRVPVSQVGLPTTACAIISGSEQSLPTDWTSSSQGASVEEINGSIDSLPKYQEAYYSRYWEQM